jgi:hypothetical protein
MKRDRAAAVPDPDELGFASFEPAYLIASESRLRTEGASGPLLAGQAMADGDPDGFAGAVEMELAAAA